MVIFNNKLHPHLYLIHIILGWMNLFYFIISSATNLMNFVHKNKVPLEYCIVEVVFSLMFHQPKPKYLEVMFGSVFIELSKLSTNTMPLVLAQTTEILYSRIESMHVCAFDRFILLLLIVICNFLMSRCVI